MNMQIKTFTMISHTSDLPIIRFFSIVHFSIVHVMCSWLQFFFFGFFVFFWRGGVKNVYIDSQYRKDEYHTAS